MSYIEATYVVISEKKFSAEEKAKELVQDVYVWNKNNYPFSDKKRLQKFEIKILDAFEFKDEDTGEYRGIIKLGFPTIIFTPDIPSILSIIFGRLSLYGRIRLVALDFPLPFLDFFKGANYGIDGIRDKLGVHHEPLLMTTIETYTLSTSEIADLFYKIAVSGADIIKENEAFFDESLAHFEDRIKACLEKKKEAEDFTGRKIIYAPNLTGRVDKLIEKAKKGVELGVEAYTINVVPYGFDTLHRLSEEVDAIFIANPAFAGTLYQSKDYGIEAHLLFGKILRLIGTDVAIFPSPYGDYPLLHHHAMEVSEALRDKFGNLKPVFPAPSMGIYPDIIPVLFKDFGNQVVINVDEMPYLHPNSVSAGIKAYRDILDCTVNGVSIEDCSSVSEELKEFLKKFKR